MITFDKQPDRTLTLTENLKNQGFAVSSLDEIGFHTEKLLGEALEIRQYQGPDYYSINRAPVQEAIHLLLQKGALTSSSYKDVEAQAPFVAHYYHVTDPRLYSQLNSKNFDRHKFRLDEPDATPWRHFSVKGVSCRQIQGSWELESIHDIPEIIQEVPQDDIRSWPRYMNGFPKSFLDPDTEIHRFVLKTLNTISPLRPDSHNAYVRVWSVTTLVHPGENALAAIEGRHQDGVDFVVPALVIDRTYGIEGGESQVWTAQTGGHCLFNRALNRGEFTLVDDRWRFHDITGMSSLTTGSRYTFGLDLKFR